VRIEQLFKKTAFTHHGLTQEYNTIEMSTHHTINYSAITFSLQTVDYYEVSTKEYIFDIHIKAMKLSAEITEKYFKYESVNFQILFFAFVSLMTSD